MRRRVIVWTALLLAGGAFVWTAATHQATPPGDGEGRVLPYAEAGLSEREAALHLLRRFTFGPRPGDADRVVDEGLEAWLDRQLRADLSDRALERNLRRLPALSMDATELVQAYPPPFLALRRAAQASGLSMEDLQQRSEAEQRRTVRAYMDEEGLQPQRALVGQLIGQKLLRAVYSENQLQEVLTSFWFNHFNVSIQDNQARPYVLAYERDAIRPHVLGPFRTLLGGTARHPAMLHYLDNAQSTALEEAPTTMDDRLGALEQRGGLVGWIARRRIREGRRRMQREREAALRDLPEDLRPRRGVNENYARELMELHTLGVDGGFTQQDVEEVARAFTGWAVVPPTERADRIRQRLDRGGKRAGFVIEDAFLFRADVHDAGVKTVLGETLPAGGGLEDGARVLDLVAAHRATARHLARKMAVRFVSDAPPDALVDHLAEVFLATDGDLRAVMEALAYSPHFWSAEARQAKVKSPFELAVSAVRVLDAAFRPTRAFVEWIDRMGQPLYRYQAPTGFPDEADHWINAGALLNRMNFGLHLASGRIEGVRPDLPALNDRREPETVEEALAVYVPLLLPTQATEETVALLLPMASDPGLDARLHAASTPDSTAGEPEIASAASGSDTLARTVGVILGSPGFQRR